MGSSQDSYIQPTNQHWAFQILRYLNWGNCYLIGQYIKLSYIWLDHQRWTKWLQSGYCCIANIKKKEKKQIQQTSIIIKLLSSGVQLFIDRISISGVWKCHARLARLVHITDRASNFLCIGCPWTSENWPCSLGGNQISFDNYQKIIKYNSL